MKTSPRFILSTWILAISMTTIHAYAYGPPLSSCDHMYPDHGGSAQSPGTAPFRIVTDRDCYSEGLEISVTLEDTEGKYLIGLFIQARSTGSNTVTSHGVFDTNGDRRLETLNCHDRDNSAVGHTSSSRFTKISFKWKAPDSGDVGDITFIVTSATSYSKYWVKVETKTLHYDSDCSSIPPRTTTPSPDGGDGTGEDDDIGGDYSRSGESHESFDTADTEDTMGTEDTEEQGETSKEMGENSGQEGETSLEEGETSAGGGETSAQEGETSAEGPETRAEGGDVETNTEDNIMMEGDEEVYEKDDGKQTTTSAAESPTQETENELSELRAASGQARTIAVTGPVLLSQFFGVILLLEFQ